MSGSTKLKRKLNRLITTSVGGFPKVLDDLRWFLGQAVGNQGIYQALNNLLRAFGDNFIIQGVILSGATPNIQITEGWVMLDGELLKVDAQTGIDISTDITYIKVTTFDPAGDKKAQNGSDIRAYQINRAVVEGLTGSLTLIPIVKFENLIIPAVRDEVDSAATEALKGLLAIATQAEVLAGTDNTRALISFGITTRLPLVQKIVNLGDWNMDVNGSPVVNPVPHGLDITKIRAVDVMIFNDSFATINPLISSNLSGVSNGRILIASNGVSLERKSGGDFDSPAYDAISLNRGFVTIWHIL